MNDAKRIYPQLTFSVAAIKRALCKSVSVASAASSLHSALGEHERTDE